VGGEEGLAVGLEVGLVGVEHAIEPGEELLGAVVGVEDDRDAVCGSKRANVVGSSDGAGNGSALVTVANTLSGEEGSTTLRELKDDGGLSIAGSLEGSDDSGRRGDVNGGDSELVLASVLEETEDIVTDDDTGLSAEDFLDTHDCGL
jgi:hypothetical protein